MRILILSRSTELYSTRSLFNAARRRNHYVRVLDHTHCDLIVRNGAPEVYYNGHSIVDYEVIIPRIGHTVTKFGATVIRQFQALGAKSILDPEALMRARDKLTSLQILASHGVLVPTSVYANNQYFLRQMSEQLEHFPKIIKLLSGTHGVGVLKADDQSTLESVMEAFIGVRQKAMIQEFIKESSGVDIRAFVVDGRVVASMRRSAKAGEFRSNLHRGATADAIELSAEEEATALKSAEVMGLRVAGVDMLRADRGPVVLEVNASPGLEGIENTTKVDVAKEIIILAEQMMKEGDK